MKDRQPTHCTAKTRQGQPCRSWAVHDSDPPQCVSHGGSQHQPGPPGNANAETHGAYTSPPDHDIDLHARIADLDRRISRLSAYIDRIGPDHPGIEIKDYAQLLGLHGQLCSRLGRLLRDQQHLQGADNTELEQAMNDALDLAGDLLGIEV